jgi:hypothetical protein
MGNLDDTPPSRRGSTASEAAHETPTSAITRWGGAAAAAKALLGLLLLGLSALVGALITLQSVATHRDVAEAVEREDARAAAALERHAAGGHIVHEQRLLDHDEQLRVLHGELTWQGLALEAIADKLRVRLPPRPRARPVTP